MTWLVCILHNCETLLFLQKSTEMPIFRTLTKSKLRNNPILVWLGEPWVYWGVLQETMWRVTHRSMGDPLVLHHWKFLPPSWVTIHKSCRTRVISHPHPVILTHLLYPSPSKPQTTCSYGMGDFSAYRIGMGETNLRWESNVLSRSSFYVGMLIRPDLEGPVWVIRAVVILRWQWFCHVWRTEFYCNLQLTMSRA